MLNSKVILVLRKEKQNQQIVISAVIVLCMYILFDRDKQVYDQLIRWQFYLYTNAFIYILITIHSILLSRSFLSSPHINRSIVIDTRSSHVSKCTIIRLFWSTECKKKNKHVEQQHQQEQKRQEKARRRRKNTNVSKSNTKEYYS